MLNLFRRSKGDEDLNVEYTRCMWENKIGTLLIATMTVRKTQYESGGVADTYGHDSPQMKLYEDQYDKYKDEIVELRRRLRLPGLNGLTER